MSLTHAAATLALLAGAMTAPPSVADLAGPWGGAGSTLTVTGREAVLQQGCASGNFTLGKLSNGMFSARGVWSEDQPGPQDADAPSAAATATYQGRIAGDTLTLTITPQGRPPQIIELIRGKRAKIIRCL